MAQKRLGFTDIRVKVDLEGDASREELKHFAGIEKIALVAERHTGGYVINGMLPWVSNIGTGNYFGKSKISQRDLGSSSCHSGHPARTTNKIIVHNRIAKQPNLYSTAK